VAIRVDKLIHNNCFVILANADRIFFPMKHGTIEFILLITKFIVLIYELADIKPGNRIK